MATFTTSATIDALIEGVASPTLNFGNEVVVIVQVAYSGEDKTIRMRGLGNFDVSPIAADTINSASLWLYHSVVVRNNGNPNIFVQRCTRPSTWVEDEVTWEEYSSGNAWTAEGGDVDAVTPTKVDVVLPGSTGWQEITGLEGHVTDAIANRGNIVSLLLNLEDEDPGAGVGNHWNSKENGSNTWYLSVDYTPASPAGIPFERPSRQQRALLRR